MADAERQGEANSTNATTSGGSGAAITFTKCEKVVGQTPKVLCKDKFEIVYKELEPSLSDNEAKADPLRVAK